VLHKNGKGGIRLPKEFAEHGLKTLNFRKHRVTERKAKTLEGPALTGVDRASSDVVMTADRRHNNHRPESWWKEMGKARWTSSQKAGIIETIKESLGRTKCAYEPRVNSRFNMGPANETGGRRIQGF